MPDLLLIATHHGGFCQLVNVDESPSRLDRRNCMVDASHTSKHKGLATPGFPLKKHTELVSIRIRVVACTVHPDRNFSHHVKVHGREDVSEDGLCRVCITNGLVQVVVDLVFTRSILDLLATLLRCNAGILLIVDELVERNFNQVT